MPGLTNQLSNSLLDKFHGATMCGFSTWRSHQTSESGTSVRQLTTAGAATSSYSRLKAGFYRRQGKAITNFQATLPPLQSDLARQILKDPYNFDFLTLSDEAHERDLERQLLANLP